VSDLPHSLGVEGKQFVFNVLWMPFSKVVTVESPETRKNLVRSEATTDTVTNLRARVVDEPTDVFRHEVNQHFTGDVLKKRLDLIQIVAAPTSWVDEDEGERISPTLLNEVRNIRNRIQQAALR